MNDFISQYRKTIKEISEIVRYGDFDVEEIRTLTYRDWETDRKSVV